jgi:hypothetical protein
LWLISGGFLTTCLILFEHPLLEGGAGPDERDEFGCVR